MTHGLKKLRLAAMTAGKEVKRLRIFSVSEANKYIKQVFDADDQLAFLYIQGELSNFKRHYSGHCYFTLKDSNAALRAVMFKSRAQGLRFEPRDGLKVIAAGAVTVFERDGQYQLYAEQLTPAGLGELSLAFSQLKDKLAKEGLFDEERKKALPLLPRQVGIVTSPTGAVLRDIVTVSKRRHPGVCLVLFPVQVQGPEAPPQIVRAIEVFNRLARVDVIIAGRGGGSIEDLWAFNDEKVVRAIAASGIPVVSAVGHQTDYTLADFAADRRAATPSQAAEIVVPDVKELQRYIVGLKTTLATHMQNLLKQQRVQVRQYLDGCLSKQPQALLTTRRHMVDGCMQRLEQATGKILTVKRHNFTVAAGKLGALDPLAVLARGYSVVQNAQGKVVKTTADVQPGQTLAVILRQGRINVEVVSLVKEEQHAEN